MCFLSGFTSKAVGTEREVKVPSQHFHLVLVLHYREPKIYGSILKQKIMRMALLWPSTLDGRVARMELAPNAHKATGNFRCIIDW